MPTDDSARRFHPSFPLGELLALYWHGERNTAEALYRRLQERFYGRIRTLVARRGANPDDHADDILQKFCLDLLVINRDKLAANLQNRDDDYVYGYLLRRLRWAVQDHFSTGSAPRQETTARDDYATEQNDLAAGSANDTLINIEIIDIIFALLAAEPCDRRALYIAYHYGVKLADLSVLTGANENTIKNRVITRLGPYIKRCCEDIERGGRPQPARLAPADVAKLRACEASAENRRLALQDLFNKVDSLLATLDPAQRQRLLAALAGADQNATGSALLALGVQPAGLSRDGLLATLSFIRALRALPCEPREALLCWDYLRQPLADVVRATVSPAALPFGQDPIEIVYQRWQRGASAVLDGR